MKYEGDSTEKKWQNHNLDPNWCPICKCKSKTIDHLLIIYDFAKMNVGEGVDVDEWLNGSDNIQHLCSNILHNRWSNSPRRSSASIMCLLLPYLPCGTTQQPKFQRYQKKKDPSMFKTIVLVIKIDFSSLFQL